MGFTKAELRGFQNTSVPDLVGPGVPEVAGELSVARIEPAELAVSLLVEIDRRAGGATATEPPRTRWWS